MRQALVHVRPRESEAIGFAAVHSILTESGIVGLEMLSCDVTSGVLRVTLESEVDRTELEAAELVRWVEHAGERDGRPTYLFEVGGADLAAVADADVDGLVPGERLELDGEGFTFDLAGPQTAISDAVEAFDRHGLDVTLETLRDYDPAGNPLDGLTDRQQHVLETAFGLGYHDVPRTATTDAVADELGLDASTVTEHLQRAERNLLEAVLGRRASDSTTLVS